MKAKRKPLGFDYAEYLQSEAWKVRRQWKLEAADHRCQVCDAPHNLQVHHRTYDRIGEEREADLVVLCDDCHRQFHGIPDPPLAIEAPRPPLVIIPNPAKWGSHATRVAEIHRELRLVDPARQMALLNELTGITRERQAELHVPDPAAA